MTYTKLLVLAALASAATCPSRAAQVDIRYYNPGAITYDSLRFEVDGQPHVELPSGCPGPGDPVTGPICVSQLQLGEGSHQVRASAWTDSARLWSGPSNTITVQGAPEPGLGVGLGLGALALAWVARRR